MSAVVEVHMRERFQCSVCHKAWARETRARSHVREGCTHDPETKGCPTCVHDLGWDETRLTRCELDLAGFNVVRHCPSWEAKQ